MPQHFDSVVVDISKLRDYCLSEFHPRGKHKARVFRVALGLTAADSDALRDALLNAVVGHPDELRSSFFRNDNGCRHIINPLSVDCPCWPEHATVY